MSNDWKGQGNQKHFQGQRDSDIKIFVQRWRKYFITGHKVPGISRHLLLGSNSLSLQGPLQLLGKRSLKPSSEILIQLASNQFDATTKDLCCLINMLMLRQKSEQNAPLDKPGSKAWHCHGNHRRPLISYQIKSLENSGPWHICPLQRGGQQEVMLTTRLPSLIEIIIVQRLHVTKWKKD